MLVILTSASIECSAQRRPKTGGNTKRDTFFYKLFHPEKKAGKPEGPRSATKAIRKQQKAEEDKKKEYNEFVSDSKKRAYEIQTPKVQERMKQNKIEIREREKNRKKKNSSNTRQGSRKYR
jgi:hypothetical protein